MKIALIDPSLFTLPYDCALTEGLVENGHKVILFGKHLSSRESGKGTPRLEELFYPGFQRRRMRSLPQSAFLALKGLAHPLSLARLLRRLRRFQPDVIHFQWAPLPVIDRYFLPHFRKIAPVILTVHDSTPFNGNPRAGLQRLSSVSIMHDFDRLIVHTEHARERLIDYGLAASRIAHIPHGILETEAHYPPYDPRDGELVRLLLFGKLKPYKGADLLIRALAALPPETKARTRLHIAGKPYMDTAPLRALAAELGVEGCIIWDLRFIDDHEIPDIFGKADIMTMPYREIDASGVLMQALAMGRPVLASRIGLFAEILENGKHGYLVPPDDPLALAVALAPLIDNPQLRRDMGAAVRGLKDSIPRWRDIATMTESLYDEVLRSR